MQSQLVQEALSLAYIPSIPPSQGDVAKPSVTYWTPTNTHLLWMMAWARMTLKPKWLLLIFNISYVSIHWYIIYYYEDSDLGFVVAKITTGSMKKKRTYDRMLNELWISRTPKWRYEKDWKYEWIASVSIRWIMQCYCKDWRTSWFIYQIYPPNAYITPFF